MKQIVVAVGFLVLVASVVADMSDPEMLIAEMRKLEGSIPVNKTIGELVHEIVSEGRAALQDISEFVDGAVKKEQKAGRSGRSFDEEAEKVDVAELLKQVAAFYDDRQSRSEELGGEFQEKGGYGKGGKGGGIGGALIQKPVLIPIPGPPGPPGPPGVPGLPGIPGKSPNLKGLKAILLARLAKVLLLIKAVLVLCLGLNAAILATTLGLTLPAYGKFKKAGVVVPVDEEPSYGYQQSSYQQPSYQPSYQPPPPAGPYNRRSGRAGGFAPMSSSFLRNTQKNVFSALDKGNAKYGRRF